MFIFVCGTVKEFEISDRDRDYDWEFTEETACLDRLGLKWNKMGMLIK